VLLLLLELEGDELLPRVAALSRPRRDDRDLEDALAWNLLQVWRRPLSLGVRLGAATGLESRQVRFGELDRDLDRPCEERRER